MVLIQAFLSQSGQIQKQCSASGLPLNSLFCPHSGQLLSLIGFHLLLDAFCLSFRYFQRNQRYVGFLRPLHERGTSRSCCSSISRSLELMSFLRNSERVFCSVNSFSTILSTLSTHSCVADMLQDLCLESFSSGDDSFHFVNLFLYSEPDNLSIGVYGGRKPSVYFSAFRACSATALWTGERASRSCSWFSESSIN